MIVSDMRAAGFLARVNGNGNALVSLTRPLMPHEVEAALESAGYDPSQCQLHRTAGGMVEVVAITGVTFQEEC
jgi:hypothetical protein